MSFRSTPSQRSSILPSASPAMSSSTSLAESSRRQSSFTSLSGHKDSRSNGQLGKAGPRPFGLSDRKVSVTASNSGTSTPTLRRLRRARREGTPNGDAEKDTDWAGMEPDEVFRRLPVTEVRKVESKMRAEALNKQSELRSMVGTRYRDLLTSATQITTLRSSSLRLSQSLRTLAATCADPGQAMEADGEQDDGKSEETDMDLLPAAAHMKLLLDAPEALYAHLASHAFLRAAMLWLVTRVVKESLSAMPEEQSEPYLPLLHQQWETLLPFRTQIVQRATALLRARNNMEPIPICETLLAIILLDNLTVKDALSLYLSQRTKAIQDILRRGQNGQSPNLSTSPQRTRPRSNSKIANANAARADAHERDVVTKILSEAVTCLLESSKTADHIFAGRKTNARDTSSVLQEMIRRIQHTDQPPPASKQSTPIRKTSHGRRTSRLASISAPFNFPPPTSSNSELPIVTTTQVLQPLPSSQVWLHHLPSSILGFTPFIAPNPPPPISESLTKWHQTCTTALKEALPGWLTGLQSVTDVWQVKSALDSILNDGDVESTIREALEEEWGARVELIWAEKLDAMVVEAEARLRTGRDAVTLDGADLDTDSSSFMFSDLTFPSAPASALTAGSQNAAVSAFMSSLKKRTTLRTPALDSVLTGLEDAAADIKVDLQSFPLDLYDRYGERLSSTLGSMVEALGAALETESAKGAKKRSPEAELFVGRAALFLARSSTVLDDLAGKADVNLASVRQRLVDVHSSSTVAWRERSVTAALSKLAPLFDADRSAADVRACWQGSHPLEASTEIMYALRSLVDAVPLLGLPPGVNVSAVPDLMSAFIAEARGLEGWEMVKDASAVQAAVDLGIIALLCGEEPDTDPSVKKVLSRAGDALPDGFRDLLHGICLDYLRRTQFLLHPLVQHLSPPAQGKDDHAKGPDARMSAILRFGPPAARGPNTEFRSPIAIAKPGKRFGLLSLVN